MVFKLGLVARSAGSVLAPIAGLAFALALGTGCQAPQSQQPAEDERSEEAASGPNAPEVSEGSAGAGTAGSSESAKTAGSQASSTGSRSKAPAAAPTAQRPESGAKTANEGNRAEAPPVRQPELEPEPAPRIVEVEVPAGTVLELELLTPIDSSVNRAGDELQAKTLSPLFVEGKEVLAAGAYVEGRVTEVQASGRVKGRAHLAFTFDRLRTSSGTVKLQTSYVEREAESGSKKDAAVIGGAAGVGAIVGGIIGGKKGAAIGATVGGAGGTGVVLTTKGEEIRLPAGTQVNVRLDQSIAIRLN